MTRKSMSLHRPSLGGITRPSMTAQNLQPIRDEIDGWLKDRQTDVDMSAVDSSSIHYSPRPSAHYGPTKYLESLDGRLSFQGDGTEELVEEALVIDDAAVYVVFSEQMSP